jgi:hypothetical protein
MRRRQKQNQYKREEEREKKQEQSKNDLKHAIKRISMMILLGSIFNGK